MDDSKGKKHKYLEDFFEMHTPKPQWQRHKNADRIANSAFSQLWETLDHRQVGRSSKGAFQKSVVPYEIKVQLRTGERVGIYSVPEQGTVQYKRNKDIAATEVSPQELLNINAKENIYSVFLLDHPTLKSYVAPKDFTQNNYHRWNEPDFELEKNHYESLAKLENTKETAMGTVETKEGILQSWMRNQLLHHYLRAPEDTDGEPNLTFMKGDAVHYKPGKLAIALPFDRNQPGLLVPVTYEHNTRNSLLEKWLTQNGAKLL